MLENNCSTLTKNEIKRIVSEMNVEQLRQVKNIILEIQNESRKPYP